MCNSDGFGEAVVEESGREVVAPSDRAILATATEMGYFEVPRQCTLADVAEEAGVPTAEISRSLRRGINATLSARTDE